MACRAGASAHCLGTLPLQCPRARVLLPLQVRQVQDAQERLKKELAQMHRSKSAKSLADETLQRQIEGDRAGELHGMPCRQPAAACSQSTGHASVRVWRRVLALTAETNTLSSD